MNEHAQGTWEASGDQVVTIDGNSIADVYGGHTMDEIEANTRLIAAAPDCWIATSIWCHTFAHWDTWMTQQYAHYWTWVMPP